MTVSALCTEDMVRDVLRLNSSAQSAYDSGQIGSNIRWASQSLERWTKRILRDEPDLQLTFSTYGAARMILPGLREATSVSLDTAVLTADSTYHLIPDRGESGLFTAIQVRPFGRQGADWYKNVPDWFERNLDQPYWSGGGTGWPNDLVIEGAWGFEWADLPPVVSTTSAILAAFLTLRPDALLSGAKATEAGLFDLSKYPLEVQSFVADWKLEAQAAGV